MDTVKMSPVVNVVPKEPVMVGVMELVIIEFTVGATVHAAFEKVPGAEPHMMAPWRCCAGEDDVKPSRMLRLFTGELKVVIMHAVFSNWTPVVGVLSLRPRNRTRPFVPVCSVICEVASTQYEEKPANSIYSRAVVLAPSSSNPEISALHQRVDNSEHLTNLCQQ
jgi:hypothetical protein